MPLDIRFPSGDGECAAWVFLPDGVPDPSAPPASGPRPVVVLGHGLGGTRDMRLAAFAEAFRADGYLCVVFDHRHFGNSSGEPRQLLDVERQLTDWAAAVACARNLPAGDPDRVVVWGSSFGGGHVLTAAARDPRVAAVVAQCPFTDGPASALRLDPLASLKVGLRAVRDVVGSWLGRAPVRVALAGERGSAALMTAPDALPGYRSQLTSGTTFRNEVAARFVFQLVRYRPGRRIRELAVPALVCVCGTDTVAPPGPTRRYAGRGRTCELREFPFGHFAIYDGPGFDAVVADQREFLLRTVPV